ncbi:MAG: hypothetical protein GEU71_03645 [Actinobacteria bacterium]|nr:hypothetical protein [Actinomycetota bacterium]
MAEPGTEQANTTETGPAPSQPSADPEANLDAAMAQALEAINAEAGEESQEGTSDQTDQTGKATPKEPDPESGEDEESQDEGATPEGQKPPRRAAPKLAEQLTQAEQRTREYHAQLQQRETADQQVLQQFSKLTGTDQELQDLTDRGLRGDDQAAERAQAMKEWRKVLPPLYRHAQSRVFGDFAQGFSELRTLEGMDGDTHQALMAEKSPLEAMKKMHQAGEKAARERLEGELQALRQEVKTLKAKGAANGRQPAAGGGQTSGTPAMLSRLLDPKTGLPTDEAEQLAMSGALSGVDLNA